MLALFKGELSYNEFMWQMPYKEMLALRDARVKQILEEREASEKAANERMRENAREMILRK